MKKEVVVLEEQTWMRKIEDWLFCVFICFYGVWFWIIVELG